MTDSLPVRLLIISFFKNKMLGALIFCLDSKVCFTGGFFTTAVGL